ncbi:dihydrofolate reductase family protein [Nocardia sp. NBC_01503]|uniref:dihydrofolate reductase family protein n=1 Tax=Nocardia sp. NBC_01503 TaxID=2975997 RepID=UPI002E7C26BB|nr:dihydrofolate reductase family protein [Nocardia sp. NBC_01503]WTL32856.1 dihydrofolate reductase family protein [Nocardia sp. NBC_01503]
MRDLVVTQNITLDGVIDASQGWFSVGAGEHGETDDVLAELMKHTENCDAVLYGRVTFEGMREYWPKQADDETGITAELNEMRKYAVSRTMGDPGWQNSEVLRDLDEVRVLKQQPGKDIVSTGSITLVHDLTAAGLVDEYRLFVYPVVLGQGARMFPEGAKVPSLRLIENKRFRSGIVLLRYRTD